MLKQSKRLLVMAFILLVCLAGVTTAAATGLNPDGAAIGTEQNPAQATITKHLRLPIGTITPNATFNFVATRVSVDGRAPVAETDMPNLNPAALAVSFTPADTDPTDPPTSIMSIWRETGDLFYGVTFPHAGIFVYEIREAGNTNPEIDNDPNQWLSYSDGARYTLTVYVANTADGTGTFVFAVGTLVTVPDNEGQTEDTKVDATPGGDDETYFFSQMVFTNDYVRTNTVTNPGANSTLAVSKQVAGDFASREQFFDFDITLTVPSILENLPVYYRAYVVENGAVINPQHNAEAGLIGTDAGGSYIRISTSGPTAFRLRDGQRLAFVDTPVGTAYVVNEAAAINYTPSLIVTTNNIPGQNIPGTLSQGMSTGNQHVGELTNQAAFTNTRDFVTPTGLNLNNLPFYGLILLAIGALITFIVIKVRRRSDYS